MRFFIIRQGRSRNTREKAEEAGKAEETGGRKKKKKMTRKGLERELKTRAMPKEDSAVCEKTREKSRKQEKERIRRKWREKHEDDR